MDTMTSRLHSATLAVMVISALTVGTGMVAGAPPAGVEWRLVEGLSDEFNTLHANPSGDGLDRSKWWDFHPTWTGRLPSQFSAANTWVDQGVLHLRSTPRIDDMSEVADPLTEHWVDSAVVVSRAEAQPGDYFEASIKIAGLSMSSAWWFAQGAKSEIDVIENIGLPSALGLVHRESEMSFNTHVLDPPPIASVGGEAQMFNEVGEPLLSREHFVTYGVWWKSPSEIRLYYNDIEVASLSPASLFDEGLNMIFDMEVFHWVGLPDIASLNDASRNTTRVDWVRGYRPVANPDPGANFIDNPGFEAGHVGAPNRPDLWSDCGKDDCGEATPFESRSSEQAHSGEWSMKIDNAQPNSFGQYKEVRPGDVAIPVRPGDTIHHEVWVKATEPWQRSDETFNFGVRLNGDPSQPRTGSGRAVLADGTVLAEFSGTAHGARQYNINEIFGGEHLNEWVRVEFDLKIPATDTTGAPVEFITALTFIDNRVATQPSQGIMFLDDFALQLIDPEALGDFDGNGHIDGADFLAWQRGQTSDELSSDGLTVWQSRYGDDVRIGSSQATAALPEPPIGTIIVMTSLGIASRRTTKSQEAAP